MSHSASFPFLFLMLLFIGAICGAVFLLRQQSSVSPFPETAAIEDSAMQKSAANAPTHIPAAPPEARATLLFAGDIMLSREIGAIMARQNDWRYPFLEVADFLRGADIAFGNLEGPISLRGTNVGSIYSFRADPRAIEGLEFAGFDVVSVANNHIWDYGALAFADTLALLRDARVYAVGGGMDFSVAHMPAILEAQGIRVAFLAYTDLVPPLNGARTAQPATAFLDESQMKADIAAAKSAADIVAVSFHWGEEYEVGHNAAQERVAKAAIDAGASLVVGHHPHVPQEVETYGGGYIFYSLGNFVFDQNFSDDTQKGLAAKVVVSREGVVSVEQIPIRFTPSFQPIVGGAEL